MPEIQERRLLRLFSPYARHPCGAIDKMSCGSAVVLNTVATGHFQDMISKFSVIQQNITFLTADWTELFLRTLKIRSVSFYRGAGAQRS